MPIAADSVAHLFSSCVFFKMDEDAGDTLNHSFFHLHATGFPSMAGSGDPAAGGDPEPVKGKGEVGLTSHIFFL